MKSRQNITLRNGAADEFNELREQLSQYRVGDDVGPTEMVRILMDRAEFPELPDS